ncbi:MAG: hypothetical protein ACYC09_04370 [Bacteroidota bacterium]
MKQKIFFLFFSLTLALCAQDNGYQVGGYVKYLFSTADSPTLGRVNDHIFHSRLNGRYFLSDEITAAAEVRNRIFAGGSVEQVPNYISSIRSDHDLGNADVIWWTAPSTAAHSEIDRLWIDGTFGDVTVSAGRQRIAWGTALVWNPTDLFNPLSILDFDYEERPGVDAIRAQYFMSEVSKMEIAIKPGRTGSRRVIAGKVLINSWAYDIHLIGGTNGEEPFVGFAWAGDIAGAGFRGEMISRKIGSETAVLFPSLRDAWTTTAVLSFDYTFTNNTYLHTEALFNNRGTTKNAAVSVPLARALGLFTPARWSLFQEISFDVHPLVRVSGFIIFNPNDRSSASVPSATWSVVENFDLSIFGIIFSGNPMTEYGGYGETFLIRGKYSF